MIFDAQAARALASRTHNLADCLAAMKKAVLDAAQVGEFEATVALPEAIAIVAGQSTNNAAFLIDFLSAHGVEVWADAVRHALHAGYALRPSWRSVTSGAALDGLTLSWHLVDVPDVTEATLLMAATAAYTMSQAEQVHQRWVEALKGAIRKAAVQGKPSVTVHEAAPAGDPAWSKRCAILQHAGYTTALIASDKGASLVIGW